MPKGPTSTQGSGKKKILAYGICVKRAARATGFNPKDVSVAVKAFLDAISGLLEEDYDDIVIRGYFRIRTTPQGERILHDHINGKIWKIPPSVIVRMRPANRWKKAAGSDVSLKNSRERKDPRVRRPRQQVGTCEINTEPYVFGKKKKGDTEVPPLQYDGFLL